VVTRTSWLRRRALATKSPEMMAALGALTAYWKEDETVSEVISMARKSRDADVRQAVNAPRASTSAANGPE
jgi:hypothetical protein